MEEDAYANLAVGIIQPVVDWPSTLGRGGYMR